MSLRPREMPGRAIAVFPFLKTTDSIQLGSFAFRSTDDTSDLSAEDSTHVREIADMLFMKDDLRIRSASYAIAPPVSFEETDGSLPELENIQAVVAYCYSAPRHTFGDILFHFEQASLAIFSPQPVTTFLVRPDHHVVPVTEVPPLDADQFHQVSGYEGRFNFSQPFWVIKGSRLYPPIPHITLNDSQNLGWDVASAVREAPQHHLLPTLMQAKLSDAGQRVVIAIRWYNRANSYLVDKSEAILSLAVGFETLLGLPRDAKIDRFVDAVSLLLGRVPRLNIWAVQFYAARSDVAHEGRTERFRLMPATQKITEQGSEYQSLLSYGRQIFQLCVGSVLFGAHLAEKSGLKHKLITNQERLELICEILKDDSLSAADRFTGKEDMVSTVNEYRYVIETGLVIQTMIGAIQVAAKALLESGTGLDPAVNPRLSDLASAKRSADGYEVLVALQAWHDVMPKGALEPKSPEDIMRRLTEIVWHYNFRRYFWMKEQRDNDKNAQAAE